MLDSGAVKWQFWLWWVVASSAGWIVGSPLGKAVAASGDLVVPRHHDAVGVAAAVIVLGVLQWMVLRRNVPQAAWWMLANIAAVAAALVFAMVVVAADMGLVVAAGGTVLGVLQWLVLRRQVSQAGWWVLASTVGWVGGGFVSGISDTPIGLVVLGIAYGAITATALVWLLRQSSPAAAMELPSA